MHAVRMHAHGGPEVLRYEEAPTPSPGPGQVLIRVRAASINHLDIWNRKGGAGRMMSSLPHILGNDAAGEIVELGDGVSHLSVGQRVIVNPGFGCGHCAMCLSGRDSLCREYEVIGYGVPGTYADYALVPAGNIVPMPGNLDYAGAAAIGLVFLTAWHMLVPLADLRRGETVLVLGAGSGVGSAAIEIAKLLGARVIATASGVEKAERARELGADHVIDHASQDIYRETHRLTDRRGVDVVFEHVGQATWPSSIRSLVPGGRLVTCGATTGPFGETDIRYVFSRQLRILGSYMGSRADLLEVLRFFETGELHPVVDSVLPLSEAAAGHQRIEERRHFGKVVLVP